MRYRIYSSPLGSLMLAADESGLRHVKMEIENQPWPIPDDWKPADNQLDEVCRQLDEYFTGQRQRFDLKLAPVGTEFQCRVWQALQDIAYGQICSYRDLAERIGSPVAMRAVGRANGANPIPIIIPCHRVIGQDGSLTGYSGGLARKEFLLRLEGISL